MDVITGLGFDIISLIGLSVFTLVAIRTSLYRCSSTGCKVTFIITAVGAIALVVWILAENNVILLSEMAGNVIFWTVMIGIAVSIAAAIIYRSEYMS